MKEQPEALRLADRLTLTDYYEFDAALHCPPAAAELRRLHSHEFANEVWQVKTQWVQDTAKPEELGMHRADVMRQRLVRAEAQRDALLEALRAIVHAATVHACHHALSVDGQQFYDIARAAIAKAEEA